MKITLNEIWMRAMTAARKSLRFPDHDLPNLASQFRDSGCPEEILIRDLMAYEREHPWRNDQ